MSEQDPPRLVESSSPYLRSLLRAGESDVPSEAQLASLASKLGPVLGGAGGGGGPAAKGGVAIKAASTGAALKIAGGALLAATLAVGSTVYVAKQADVPTRTTATGIAISSSSATAEGTALPAPAETPAPNASIAPPASARKAPSVAESPDAEVKLLERAQDALRARPEESIALCTEHAARFPHGLLTQEREVIAIEALTLTGRPAEAKARARRFTVSYPTSTHLRRVETLVGASENTK